MTARETAFVNSRKESEGMPIEVVEVGELEAIEDGSGVGVAAAGMVTV
jgi:hypothetical protein